MDSYREPESARLDSLLDDSRDERPGNRSDSLLIVAALAIVLAIIWVAFAERTQFERRQALAVALDRDATLAVALEQYTIRVLKTVQAVTQYVSREYIRGARGQVLRELLDDRMANNDIFSGLAVIGADGQVMAATGRLDPAAMHGMPNKLDLAATQPGMLQIGRAADGARVHELSIARGMVDAQGRNQGVAMAFVSSHRFLGVFDKANLGRDSLVLLAGTDGTVRASWNASAGTPIGSIAALNLEGLATGSASALTNPNLDGVPRLIGVRKLDGYPMLAIVATSEADALAEFHSRRRIYFWASCTLSAFAAMLAASLLLLSRRRDRLAANLRKAKARLRSSNANLEIRIAQRTSQLATANRDLQLFTSALAHDVRAPLAAIDGFSQQLEPAIAATGNDRLKHQLSRIRANTRHMSELTESMLQLARLAGQAVHPVPTDVTAMAHTVVHGLREREPDRQVEVDIEEDLQVHADAVMLREVLENLIGNAWKFSSKRADARIKIASFPGERGSTMRTVLVSDNGAGFDMEYAGQLFRPFRRLHVQSEFAGTGVGLAMVHRIIGLHGGRVWAESAPEQGATFYFSLPADTPRFGTASA